VLVREEVKLVSSVDNRIDEAARTGRKQLIEQTTRWDSLVQAIGQIMHPAEE
jgi:hypothetical protein